MLSRREKLLIRPWQQRRYMDHRRKVNTALPAIDVEAPATRSHVLCKSKKLQKESERCAQIAEDNFILIRHLNDIMKTHRIDNYWIQEPPTTILTIRTPSNRKLYKKHNVLENREACISDVLYMLDFFFFLDHSFTCKENVLSSCVRESVRTVLVMPHGHNLSELAILVQGMLTQAKLISVAEFLNKVGIYKQPEELGICKSREIIFEPKLRSRKERCYACGPLRFLEKEVIPEERIPWDPDLQRTECKKSSVLSEQSKQLKVIRCDMDLPEFRGQMWSPLPGENRKKKNTNYRELPVRSMNCHTFSNHCIELTQGPSNLSVNFPTKTTVVHKSGKNKRTLHTNECQCKAFHTISSNV